MKKRPFPEHPWAPGTLCASKYAYDVIVGHGRPKSEDWMIWSKWMRLTHRYSVPVDASKGLLPKKFPIIYLGMTLKHLGTSDEMTGPNVKVHFWSSEHGMLHWECPQMFDRTKSASDACRKITRQFFDCISKPGSDDFSV